MVPRRWTRIRRGGSWRKGGVELLESRQLLAADLFISEFMASNDIVQVDRDGDASDWIEIFNAGPDDIDLQGWHLTDDADDLSKWDFPSQILPAGNFLLVYASDKDRTVPGEELHANFRLSAGGEYLALTRDAVGGQVEVVSEFSPEFPQQVTDISYGFTQQVASTTLVVPTGAATLLVPEAEPSAAWNVIGFNDADWQPVDAAVGYQRTVPGFTVQDAKASGALLNLSEAEAVLRGTSQASQTVAITPVVNFHDPEDDGAVGRFGDDLVFPNGSAADDNDFAVRATGTITIPTAGTWSFGTSSDDGVRLRIDGELVINDDTLHAPEDRFGQLQLDAGLHQLELVYFERGGGAEVELFAARGNRTVFSSAFDLVGDVEHGGLVVETSPSGGEVGFSSLVGSDIGDAMLGQASSVYLRVPFNVDDLASLDSLTLRINYDDGFVAYLNGVEVARRNAPEQLSFTATSTLDRPARQALQPEDISLTRHLGLLNSGANLLAIHGLNDGQDSDEFLIAVELAEIETATGDAVYFQTPTPGTFNSASGVREFLLDDVSLSQPHGFQEQAFQLTMSSATAGTNVRYTLDGSAPTEANGIDYAGPITIDRTTTIRARSFKADSEPSLIQTASYLFLDDVLQQSPTGAAPEGWPTSRSINGQSLDYGMDPDIVNSAVWAPQLIDALKQVPTMSVVMDVDDFIGSRNGIYTHAGSHGRAWERPASLELINPDGSAGFQVEMGIRIRGGFSRSGSNPKHAFRFFFRDEYGDAKLEYPLFGDEGVDQFDKIDLRTTQNYSWSFQGDARNTFLRDVFSRDVQGLMGQPYTRSRYYHLYINGQYWGLYQTQERSEARYAADYFGGSPEDYDVVKSAGSVGGYENEATDGNLDAYQRLADLFYQRDGLGDANMADYWRAQGMYEDGSRNPDYERLLDVDNLIDYMIITYFTSDADGPGSKFTRPRVNNYFGIFNRQNPDGFKFFEHDSEHSLDTGNAAGANYDMVSPLTTGGSQFRYFNPQWMHEQLARTNTVYRERFADAVYHHLFHAGVLAPENAKALIDSRAAEIDVAMIAESARWGDAKRGTPFTQNDWRSAVNTLRRWFDGRAETVLQQLRRQGWYPDSNPPQFLVNNDFQHGGEVTRQDELRFLTTNAITYETILPSGSVWKYLDDGSNQRTAWREPKFDDSAWQSGRAQLGYGDGDETTQVGFGPNSSDKFRTTYFRANFSVDDPNTYDAGLIRLLRDDGAVVYLNGEEIARSNMPAGSIGFETFASGTAGGTEESTYFDFEFPVGLLRTGANTLAVEIHQTNATSSDISFDLELQLGVLDLGNSGIYYTLDGSDPKLSDGAIHPDAARYDGTAIRLGADARLAVRSLDGDGTWSVLNAASFTVGGALEGDLDADGNVDADDIDALSRAIRGANRQSIFDLDRDGFVDDRDLTYLVEEILGTKRGDTDLDGKVLFNDFLVVAASFGSERAGWSDGNFDTDTIVAFGDFLELSANFGFGGEIAARMIDTAIAEL